ncbi:hypothetical protein F2Q70_00041443 [Brassica cretica]|uniref:Uncharacterized protein n=1 Tax=Brassica cretica TaxID=69181 RepID=A0A3N6U312_BRACR|nr:hypothetical protein F2Q70_00041443 [Brassica cretica]KAF3492458.1 hypothetical protein DY000_02057234 [Brassica cretica]
MKKGGRLSKGTTGGVDTSNREDPGGKPPTTPRKGVMRRHKSAAIAREEGKDAGDKSQRTTEGKGATPESKPVG